MMRPSTMYLTAFLYSGQTSQAWRHPSVDENRTLDIGYFIEYAQAAEAAGLNALFLADSSSVPAAAPNVLKSLWSVSQLEPITLMSALAVVTQKINLILTASVADTDPYLLARQIGSLDHISRGRAGWNIVTTAGPGARHLKAEDLVTSANRYERAEAFLDVAKALWASQPASALQRNPTSGVFSDPQEWSIPAIRNQFYSADTPLRLQSPPNGRPLLAQAGSSSDGRDFAARHADLIFCSALDKESAKTFYRDVKTRAIAFGRDADAIKVMVGKGIVWGRTSEEAAEKLQTIATLHPLEVALQNLGIDFSAFDVNAPFPTEGRDPLSGEIVPIWALAKKSSGRAETIARYAISKNWTIAQCAQVLAASLTHGIISGTTEEICNHLEEWFVDSAADGFAIQSPLWLNGFKEVTANVTPELIRRGLFAPN